MLVLSRRKHERIRLGDSIVVTVLGIAGDRVRLGIEAPCDVLVLRDELKPPQQSAPVPGPSQAQPSCTRPADAAAADGLPARPDAPASPEAGV